VTVRFWADPDVIHLLIAGVLVKTIQSHVSVADLSALLRQGGRPAGPPPMPPPQPGDVVEVDRAVNRFGTVSLGERPVVAADILSGRRVTRVKGYGRGSSVRGVEPPRRPTSSEPMPE
jgi:hypothetical protein